MHSGQFRLAAIVDGVPIFADVALRLAHQPSGGVIVDTALQYTGHPPPTLWQRAAHSGASRAVQAAGIASATVTLQRVLGLIVDTTPDAVAIAAYLAVGSALGRELPSREAVRQWLRLRGRMPLDTLQAATLDELDQTGWLG